MKRKPSNRWKVALAAAVVATVGLLPQARSELVYEPEVSPDAPIQVREQDREQTRQALEASVKAQDTLQATQASQPLSQPAAQPVQMVQPQYQAQPMMRTAQPVQYVAQPVQQAPVMTAAVPVQAAPAPVQIAPAPQAALQMVQPQAAEATSASAVSSNVSANVSADADQPAVESLSKTELMRRERTRQELKNEDLLEERLEELRLRDEQRRTQELLGDTSAAQQQPVAPIPGMSLQPEQSQVVMSPVTDHPGQPAPQVAPVPGAQGAVQNVQYVPGQSPYTQQAQDQINMSQAQAQAGMSTANAQALGVDQNKQQNQFYISPRAGVSSMNLNSSLSGVNASGLYSLGIAVGTSISDNLGIEVGYTNSQYGISMASMYEVPGLQQYQYQLSQNVIDAMLKLYFLGPDSKLRPYIGGGAGYSMSSLNYPSQLTSMYSYLGNQSYNSNAFLGELSAGMDIKVSKQVSIGAMFKYSDVLSTNQNNNNLYYYGGYGYGGGMVGANAQQQLTGASLSQSSFYSMLGTVNFSF